MLKQDKKKRRQAGFTLAEVMVTVGVLSMVLFAITSKLSTQYKFQMNARQILSRENIATRLERIAGNRTAIRLSATQEQGLAKFLLPCVDGDPATECTPKEKIYIELYESPGKAPITGTPQKAARYTVNAEACANNQSFCPIEAQAWYTTKCAPGQVKCPDAATVNVSFEVQYRKSTADTFRNPLSVGSEEMKPISGSVTTDGILFKAPVSLLTCPSGFATALSTTGVILACSNAN